MGTRRRDRGYVLLTILWFSAAIVIGLALIAPTIAFEIKRDREEELIHRGVQYTRAIRGIVKRTGQFPKRLAELQDSGGPKYLRKAYKDPITGKDFKLLHGLDVPALGGNNNLAASNAQADGVQGGDANSNGAQGSNADSSGSVDANAGANTSANNSAANGQQPSGVQTSRFNPNMVAMGPDTNPQFGMSILGVASMSKDKTIREFDRKNHYNDWLFFYLPQFDRGFPIKGPTPSTPISATPVSPSASQPQSTSSQQ